MTGFKLFITRTINLHEQMAKLRATTFLVYMWIYRVRIITMYTFHITTDYMVYLILQEVLFISPQSRFFLFIQD
jgi:hypothetical protein